MNNINRFKQLIDLRSTAVASEVLYHLMQPGGAACALIVTGCMRISLKYSGHISGRDMYVSIYRPMVPWK